MRSRVQQAMSWLAIYAIALHTIVLGVTPLFAAQTVDPFSVICHSAAPGAAPAEQTPAGPVSAPAKSCDHCNLCSAMASPDARDGVVIAELGPAKLLQLLRTAPAVPRDGIAYNPNRARGPPQAA